MKNSYPDLARKTIKYYLETGKILTIPPKPADQTLNKQAAAFVSIHHRNDHSLRGCIGTFLPVRKNLAQEIIYNAIAAATQDPRFPSVSLKELPLLKISVDVLSKPKIIAQKYLASKPIPKEINPKKNGLLVSTPDGRRGLLLPDIPGVKTPQKQIDICRQKGGISPNESVTLQIFTVKRHREK